MTLITHAKISNGRLVIDVPVDLPPGSVDVEIRLTEGLKTTGTDIPALLELSGTLEWKGDPMALQRKLRDEWPD